MGRRSLRFVPSSACGGMNGEWNLKHLSKGLGWCTVAAVAEEAAGVLSAYGVQRRTLASMSASRLRAIAARKRPLSLANASSTGL